ncbi:hypothetical protein SSX86_017378 [Deinandra increscens subsp. villosa]|uniref:Ubiquitin thioesterase OTU n=1 Tax=Deinandra increscens subsp. villosa TaxID=3103831 RepID=A0AAP0GU71_9ASTR
MNMTTIVAYSLCRNRSSANGKILRFNFDIRQSIEFKSLIFMSKPRKSSIAGDFRVISITGDGRCLFRSVVHGACLRAGRPVPKENVTQGLADDLRTKVVKELIKRRTESEWFLEGDFETYVSHMQRSYVWGGEPELLMSSHVLKVPITVYMKDRKTNSIKVIAEYGQEYGNQNPVTVLYHDYGHYDLLQLRVS